MASFLTVKSCSISSDLSHNLTHSNRCESDEASAECAKLGGVCLTILDAYYIETFVFTLFGIFWIIKFRKIMFNLQEMPKSALKIAR